MNNTIVKSSENKIISHDVMRKFAFLIHFRFGYSADMGQFWKPLNKMSDNFYRKIFNKLSKKSFKWSEIYLNDAGYENELLGITEMLMMSSEDMIKGGFDLTSRNINEVIDGLVEKGYTNIGLGALTSPLTKGGLLIKERTDVSITNGNAFTAVSMYNAVVQLLEKRTTLIEHQSIVGATGSVGSCVAKMLVKNNYVSKLQLVARDMPKLESLKKELKDISPSVEIEVTNDIKQIKKSNLIVLLTASAENLITKEMLKKNAFILDGTQPRNTSESLLTERPDLHIIDGGIVDIPGITLKKGKLDLPDHHYYACFSETLLLAMEGYSEHFSVGNPSLEQAEYISQLAKKYKDYGFQLADFTSFGKKISID